MGELSHRHHFLPQGNQRPFADDRGMVAVVAADGSTFETSPLNVGVKRDLYMRERPSGEKSDDIETVSLGDNERQAIPILQELRARWPLTGEEKVRVATLLGLQLMRGPRWFEFHKQFAEVNYGKHLEDGEFVEIAEKHGVTEEEVYRAHVDHELDGTRKLLRMIYLGAKAASTFGSTTWALLEFASPALALADHPIVVWPLAEGSRDPSRAEPAKIGLVNLLEVRVPVAPDLALLGTWADRPDLPEPIACGSHHAKNINAFSIEEAERHWIHRPGRVPRAGSGPWLPLGPELILGYSPRAGLESTIRANVSRELNANLGTDSREVKIHVIGEGPDLIAA